MILLNWLKRKFSFTRGLKPLALTNSMETALNKQGYIIINSETAPEMIVTEKYAREFIGVSAKDLKKRGYVFAIRRGLWKIPVRIIHEKVAGVYT